MGRRLNGDQKIQEIGFLLIGVIHHGMIAWNTASNPSA
jgi:hypothetical protein